MNNNKIFEYDIETGRVFEFNGLEYIEDFELIGEIIINELKAKVIDKMEGPTANIYKFDKDGIKFKLINSLNFGNSLMLIEQKNEDIGFLRKFAEKTYDIYIKNHPKI